MASLVGIKLPVSSALIDILQPTADLYEELRFFSDYVVLGMPLFVLA